MIMIALWPPAKYTSQVPVPSYQKENEFELQEAAIAMQDRILAVGSCIGNLHILFGGANAAQGEHQVNYPVTYTLDTLLDDTCLSGTNESLGQRPGAIRNPNGIEN